MKKLLSITSVIAALVSVNTFAADTSQYQVNVYNVTDEAIVKVTQNGQPAEGVPVHVTSGAYSKTLNTSESGSVSVRNTLSSGRSFTISVKQPNGKKYTTERFIASYQ